MRRRALLAALPVAGGLAVAGCLDRARSAVGLQSDVKTTEDDGYSTETPPEIRTLEGWKPAMLRLFDQLDAGSVRYGEAAELIAVGSDEDTHWVTVAAESEDPVEATVTLGGADGETLYETTVGVSNARYVGVMFAHVGRYTVAVETAQHEWAVTVPEGWIDCNESGHAVLLAADGSVRSTSATTELPC